MTARGQGQEIESIDNLFISPNGRLTLAETKLWRKPQAAREVVAQILDYARNAMAADQQDQITFRREQLYERLWEQPASQFAKELGACELLLIGVCKEYQGPKP